MDGFIRIIDGWHDFYHVIGDASAALIGLLFVSLSLNADVIIKKSNSDLLLLAGETFMSYFCVLMYAIIFLIPNQGPIGLGIPMLGINLSNPPAEYPAACCGDESGLFPLPWEGKLKMGWGQETTKTINIG
jgi:hypothetical protein